jgi:hypothetical protein
VPQKTFARLENEAMISSTRKLIFDRWPILVLIALPIVLLAPIVVGRVLYWGVPLLQFYPWQRAAIEAYQHGQLPLWTSLVGSGAPLAANLQTAAFYPLNFLYLILPTEFAMGTTALLHVILAGLFMYAYLRSLGLEKFSAVVGAIAFQLCGFLIARLGFLSITVTLPWLPAWLWRAERLARGEGQPISVSLRGRFAGARNVLLLGFVIGMGILAGHAQTAAYGLILVTGYFFWRAVTLSPRPPVTLSLSFVIALLLGLGLASVQLIPSFELTRESQRVAGLDFTQAMTHSYWPPRLLTLLSPDFFGNPAQNNFWGYDNYWENAAYIGVIPLLLALWAIKGARSGGQSVNQRMSEPANQPSLVTRHSSLIIFFSITVVVSLILAFGWFTIIYPFLYDNVPGLKFFQGPDRWLSITSIALCVLAAFGAQRLIDRGFPRGAATGLILAGLAVSIAGLGSILVLRGNFATFGPATLRFGVLLIAAGFIFKSAIKNQQSKILFITVVAIDLITAHFSLNPTIDPDLYRLSNPSADAIKADGLRGRIFNFDADEEAIKFGVYLAHGSQRFDGFGPNEVDYWLGEREALIPNAGMIDGVASANNFDSLIVGRYQTWLDQINQLPLDQATAALARSNVAYIVSPRALDLPIVYRGRDVMIYRNINVLPRAFIAPIDADLNQVSSILNGSAVNSLTDSGNAVTIRAVSPADGWLILSDTFYPGWRASIDGQPLEIQVATQAFRAVKFPAGEHLVEFKYEPGSIEIGAGLSIASLLILVVGAIIIRLSKRKKNDE